MRALLALPMQPVREARRWGWGAVGITLAAAPLFFVPAAGGYGDPAWAIGGALVLHGGAFVALGALVKYRDLDPDQRARARIAVAALPVLVASALALLFAWTAP